MLAEIFLLRLEAERRVMEMAERVRAVSALRSKSEPLPSSTNAADKPRRRKRRRMLRSAPELVAG